MITEEKRNELALEYGDDRNAISLAQATLAKCNLSAEGFLGLHQAVTKVEFLLWTGLTMAFHPEHSPDDFYEALKGSINDKVESFIKLMDEIRKENLKNEA
jgi:hypothetical protein